jgi:hypothetical protein
VIRAAAAALIGALASAVWLTLFYAAGRGAAVEFAVDPPRVVNGFYGAERDRTTGLTFAWTGAEAGVRLPGLDRRVPWRLTVRARGARADDRSNPELAVYVDGIHAHARQTSSAFEDIQVLVPPRPERRGTAIVLRSSSTFVPGPADRRQLGVMVDAIELTPEGLALPPPEIFGAAMLAGALIGAAVALLGVTPGTAIGAAILLSAGQAALIAHGFGPYTQFPHTVLRVSLAFAFVLAAASGIARLRTHTIRNTARFAVAFSASACLLKLLALLHPDMPLGDALFHAHRFQEVLRGNLYFTSIAPGGYAFPYAPGLYVAAAPFAGLVRRELGDVVLLRTVTTAADAAAGLLLYTMAARAWKDRLAAAIAVAVYHLFPLSFRILSVGNLTNAFAQSLSVVAFALIALPTLRTTAGPAAIALTVALTAAFLSHTSTFAILAACAFATAAIFLWKGGAALRSPAIAIAVCGTVSIVVAVALYYAHFGQTYRTELARVGAETAAAAPDAGGRGTLQRAAAVPRYLHIYLGAPALLLAAAGAFDRWRRGSRDRLTLALLAWGTTCAFFLVLGVVTPLDMRHYLAVIPAIALLGAAGASWWWNDGGRMRLLAAVVLAWVVWTGIETWWTTLV